jgi:hypothetical protein
VALTSASLILATVQQNQSGHYVRAAGPNITGSSFTVYLGEAPTASTKVAGSSPGNSQRRAGPGNGSPPLKADQLPLDPGSRRQRAITASILICIDPRRSP